MITKELIESYEDFKLIESGIHQDAYKGIYNIELWYIKEQNQMELYWQDNHIGTVTNIETDEEFKVWMKINNLKQK